jgi:hypothetical protein
LTAWREPLPEGPVTLPEIAAVYPGLAAVARATLTLPRLEPEEAEWFDGPAVYRWLTRVAIDRADELGDPYTRRIYAWKHGEACHVDSLDRVLQLRGLSIHDVPGEYAIRHFRTNMARMYGTRRHKARDEAVRRYRAGESRDDLAREFGVNRETIPRWARADERRAKDDSNND